MITIRQSTISNILYPFNWGNIPEDKQKMILERGTRNHNESQYYFAKQWSIPDEYKLSYEYGGIKINGHCDLAPAYAEHLKQNFLLELKFSGNSYFKMYDSYYFQVAFYHIASGKPVQHITTDVKQGVSVIKMFDLPYYDLYELMHLMNDAIDLYKMKLVINNKEADGRYFNVEHQDQVYSWEAKRDYNAHKIQKLLKKHMRTPSLNEQYYWNQYASHKGWRVFP